MVLGDIVGKKFQRDKTAQLGVISLINYPHAATAELCNDAIVRDSLAEHGRGSARNRVLGILGGILRELKPHSLCGRTLLSAAFAFAFEVDFAFLGYCRLSLSCSPEALICKRSYTY